MTYHVYHDFIIKRIMNAVQIIQNYAIICQNANFRDDTKNPLKSRKNPANSGKIWQRKVRKKYDKSIVHLPRQYLPQHHGAIRFPEPDQQTQPHRSVLH